MIDYEDYALQCKKFLANPSLRDREKTLSLEDQISDMQNRLRNYLLSICPTQDEATSCFNELKNLVNEFVYTTDFDFPSTVQSEKYVPWLDDQRKKSIKWSYSNRYFEYLFSYKKWSRKSIDSINTSTDIILDHCGDPKSKHFEVKGLVVGDVQSGKTANYTSLINKAIDAGYKVIVVFAGTTNDLRSQTQSRLDLEVTGFNSDQNDVSDRVIGVSKVRELRDVINITSSSKNGDLRSNSTFSATAENVCYLAVIKKCPAPLKALLKLLKRIPDRSGGDKGKINLPVLIIDDEADLASVNTSASSELNDAKATNKLIREILFQQCSKFTYIGYTATPFANVFISPHDQNLKDGDVDDIFPDDFIVSLPTPPDYCGPEQYFGIKGNQEDDSSIKTDLVRFVDQSDIDKIGGDKHVPAGEKECLCIPDSLREAVMAFLISTGAKISRGIRENCTMLINVDVSVNLNQNVKSVFENECKYFKQNLSNKREEYKTYWEKKFKQTSKTRIEKDGGVFSDKWDGENGIEAGILEAISWKQNDTVKLIAGTKDSDDLDYSKSKYGIFVCVGGQKLSRGLTLNGLSISYYGRNASAVDSLMQMGRWFGYRHGWLDLCRVFTTKKIVKQYIEAALVLENFKAQVKELNGRKEATPKTFGLYVKAANELLPTSQLKMRGASKKMISYSGTLTQITKFSKSANQENLALIGDFINKLNKEGKRGYRKGISSPIFKNVSPKEIISLLSRVQYPSNAARQWLEYINRSLEVGELNNWTVTVSSLQKGRPLKIGGLDIFKATRTISYDGDNGDELSIRALTRPSDYLAVFPEGVTPNANKYDWENDDVLRKYYTPDKCLLAIYIVDLYKLTKKQDDEQKELVEHGESIVSLAIWFPLSKKLESSEYVYLNPIAKIECDKDEEAGKVASEENLIEENS